MRGGGTPCLESKSSTEKEAFAILVAFSVSTKLSVFVFFCDTATLQKSTPLGRPLVFPNDCAALLHILCGASAPVFGHAPWPTNVDVVDSRVCFQWPRGCITQFGHPGPPASTLAMLCGISGQHLKPVGSRFAPTSSTLSLRQRSPARIPSARPAWIKNAFKSNKVAHLPWTASG
ncbi:hypothetical protein DQ04_07061010 [Trypanosoma grayi]|uniref:hypothetical protein n=1 Tax=Trypanosoma grayi TaxID=71804 RepID=UPI0004F47C2A|nr:hypothetical protein DQ04_07061010 [Trypanosoma grayi]KEG08492.1 hypothetical protein DQ04_07061010 [Trypanosoma grayi]